MRVFTVLQFCQFISVLGLSKAFYLPGFPPKTYCSDQNVLNCQSNVSVYVNRLNSMKTVLPFEYDRFDLCKIPKKKSASMNIGQKIFGERIQLSPYKIEFLKDVECQVACEKTYSPGNESSLGDLNFLLKAIKLNYQQHWIIDHMLVTWCYEIEDGNSYCSRSFPLGCYVNKKGRKKDTCVMSFLYSEVDTHYLFNHVDLIITYQRGYFSTDVPDSSIQGRILSIKLKPKSISYQEKVDSENVCNIHNMPMGISGSKLEQDVKVRYTYSVRWKEDLKTSWSSRWDYILEGLPHNNIYIFSIVNSLIVLLFLTGVFLSIARKALSNDKKEKANKKCCWPRKTADNAYNWKLIHGDVFRAPGWGMLLAILNGSGMQVFLTACLVSIFASAGMLSPANPGSLETCIILSFAILGFPAGYLSARLYKGFGGIRTWLNPLLTGTLCPGIIFLLAMVPNLVFWSKGSSAALPFTMILAIVGLWLGVSLPLTFFGAFFGNRRKSSKQRVEIEPIQRKVPTLRLYLKPLTGFIIGGILPFGCIFISIFFVLNSVWSFQVFCSFGLISLVFLLMVTTCVLVSILQCYFYLCAEDYRWWWRAFLNSSSTSVYFFLYSIHYYVTKLELEGPVDALIYFVYMVILSFILFLLTGTCGFFGCYWFVRKIYSNVKTSKMWGNGGLM